MKTTTIFGTLAAAIVVGVIVGTTGGHSTASGALAANAPSTLQRPLSADERKELVQGLQFFKDHDYDDAAPILTKYAMLGEPFSQMEVGMMHYFGRGLALDRDEGLHWLRLAGAQDSVAEGMLSVIENGNMPSIDGAPQSGQAYSYAQPSSSVSDATASSESVTQEPSRSWSQSYASPLDDRQATAPAIGAESYEPPRSGMYEPSRSAYGSESSNRGETGQFLSPVGPGTYVNSQNGNTYAGAGPNAVVNTQTGEVSPLSH